MQTGKEKTSNKKILTLATVLLVALLQPAVATVTITGSLSSDESASGSVYVGIVDFNADPIDWFNTIESSWVGNFSFPANLTNFQVEFFNVNVGNEYYLIVFVDQDSNGNPDTYEIGAIHGPFYLGSTNFNVGDIWLDTGGASGGGGGTGGMIEGTVGSSESTFGTVLVGLFDMPDPSDWNDRVSERNLGSQSFPYYDIWFDFQEEWIIDGDYSVVAFIDENSDQMPDEGEAVGMALVTVTGGYGYTGEITMSYGGGGGGPTYIQVTSPNSMSNWTAGMGESIDWNSNTSDGMDYDVDIELYKGGSYYEEIEGGYQSSSFGGNFWWSIPGYLEDGNDYQIRVYHVDSGVGDYSDYFQISGGGGGGPNYIQVTSPNSMSNWTAGSGEPLEWNSSTSDDMDYTVDIELWKSGSYYELIDQDLQSSSSGSSYWWFIPDYLPDGNDYEVRVVHFDSGVDDFSDYFQISGGGGDGPDWIDVTSPVSGSVWFAGSEESISWSSYTPDGSDYEVDIELWRDGNYYQWIVGEYPSNSSADSYQWYIPNNISDGSNYQIRVYPTPYYGVEDFSDYFEISGGGEGGFVSGNLHSEESVSGELIVGLFSPDNDGEEWDPDWWQNWYVTFPSDQYYQFDESGISDGYGYNVRAFVDANSNYSPDPEELQGKSGDFEVLDGFATNIDFDLNYEYETGGYSLQLDGNTVVETGFSAYDGGPEFTFELFFKVFYVPGTGEKFELFRREDWGILEYDGTQQKFIFGLYGIGQVEYTISLVTDEWHHIAAEYDESNLRIYLDGMVVAAFLGGGYLPETPEDINIYVGENLWGLIDIVRMNDTGIYGGSSFDPYSNDYSAGAGVHLLWHCDEGSGNELYDASGTGHTGNIYGTPTWNTDEPIGGSMDPQLWYTDVGSDYVMLEWDRWPDSDAEFDKYELRWNTYGGVNEADQSIFSMTNPNNTNMTHDFLPQGDNYYKLWMYDQGGFSRYETNEVYVNVGGGGGPTDIHISSPNSGSNWSAGTGESIEWSSNTSDGSDYYVDIELWKDGYIDEGIEGSILSQSSGGNYFWSIPNYIEDGNNYQVRVVHTESGVEDFSDYFQISGGEQVTVNYPNGGETFTEGDQMTITWDWTGGSIGLDIYLSQNSGGSFDYFIGSANATDQSYNWTIPDGADSPNCRISIEDPGNPSTNDGSDNDFTILDSGGALGEFSTEHVHLYWAAEEESSDTVVVLISNVASDGDLKIEDIYSSEPADLYPQETEDYPIFIGPGETYGAPMVITPPAGLDTWNGTITFELGNATTEIETIDYSVVVYAAGEVGITNSYIDSIELGFYDLTDQVSMTVDFSSLSSDDGGLFVTLVDGALPANPDGDQDMAIADRYWEILSNLEDGDFIADLCFDLNDLEGIDDFQSLKILRRTAYSDGTWEEVNSSDIEYDEGNSLICANDQSSFSEWTVGSDSTSGNFVVNPPAISGDIPSSVMEGEDLTFVAQIVAEGGLERALLKYHVGGGNDKEATFIQVSNNNYEATIPGSDITSRGLVGFIAARDSLQQETFTDTADIQVEYNGISLGSTSAETYRMISIPGYIYDGDPSAHFEDDLGSYDASVWRMFKWNGTDYSEYHFGNIQIGQAFWIITRDPASLTSAEGASIEMLSSSPVNLISGWNMVANPYNFSLSFSDLQDNNADIEPVLYRYTGSGYTTTNSFVPGDGVWIYAHNPTTIIFDPLGSGSMSRTVAEELTWHGSVKATSGDLTDTENLFGTHVGASSGWDVLDRHEPPVIGDYVTLAFDNNEWANHPGRYSRDIRSDTEAGHIWPFTVITNQSGYVSLSVELPDELPLGWELFLVDVAFDIVQNLSTEIEYEFVANGSETPREFELIAGPPGFTREALDDLELTPSDYRLAQNIPNPFNALTTIQFNLPKGNEVSLAIYDLVGRKVAEPLSNVPYESGGHFVIWDGKDSQNRPVSSGVYLYRLEVSKNGQMEFAKTKKLILLK